MMKNIIKMKRTILSTHTVIATAGTLDINVLMKNISDALVKMGIDKNQSHTDAFNFGGQNFDKYSKSFPSMISTGMVANLTEFDFEATPALHTDVVEMERDLAEHDIYLADALQLVERLILDGCFAKGHTAINIPLKEKPVGYEFSEIRYSLHIFRNLYGNFFVDIAMHFCTNGMVDGTLISKDERNVLNYVMSA
jgi:hypothetical protein